MKMNVPKQFIKVLGKPIMIYTLEAFDRNENIDEVVVVCLKGWEEKLQKWCDQYGIKKLDSGTRVRHAMFGEGVIVSARDMGGDVLYEVRFDSGETKRLMATFARLEKI